MEREDPFEKKAGYCFQSPSKDESPPTSPATPRRLELGENEESLDSPLQGINVQPNEIIDKKWKESLFKGKGNLDTQRIFFFPCGKKKLITENVVFVSIPHPKNGGICQFAVHNGKLFEVNRAYEEPSSWFMGDFVQQDGSVYLISPFDPLFLIIPFLQGQTKSEGSERYFCDPYSLFLNPHYSQLEKLDTIPFFLIADSKDVMGEKLYRLNNSKLIHWLKYKVENILKKLDSSESYLSVSSAQSNYFRTSKKKTKPTKEQLLRSALGFISEYVNEKTVNELAQSYGIQDFAPPRTPPMKKFAEKQETVKRKAEVQKNIPSKKPKMTRGQAQLAKVNLKGFGKISSFFSSHEGKQWNISLDMK